MLKKFTYILYKILHFFDFVLKKIFNRSFLVHLKDLVEKESCSIQTARLSQTRKDQNSDKLVNRVFSNTEKAAAPDINDGTLCCGQVIASFDRSFLPNEKLESLSTRKPSPLLKFNVLDVLLSYVKVINYYSSEMKNTRCTN